MKIAVKGGVILVERLNEGAKWVGRSFVVKSGVGHMVRCAGRLGSCVVISLGVVIIVSVSVIEGV